MSGEVLDAACRALARFRLAERSCQRLGQGTSCSFCSQDCASQQLAVSTFSFALPVLDGFTALRLLPQAERDGSSFLTTLLEETAMHCASMPKADAGGLDLTDDACVTGKRHAPIGPPSH